MPEFSDYQIPRNSRRRYHWEDWADGEVRKFTQGEDFDVKPSQFVVACRRFCDRRGWTVEAVSKKDDVFLKITKQKRKMVKKVVVKK